MKRCQGSHTAPCLATAAVEARQPGDLFKASQRVSCDTVSSATLQLPNSTVHSRLTASYGRCTASTHSLVPCLLRCVLADSECPLSGVKHGLKCLTLSVLVISIPLPITTNLRVPGAAHTCTPHHLRLSHPMHHPSSSPSSCGLCTSTMPSWLSHQSPVNSACHGPSPTTAVRSCIGVHRGGDAGRGDQRAARSKCSRRRAAM